MEKYPQGVIFLLKRAIAVFLLFSLAMTGLSVRIIDISTKTVQAAGTVSTKSIDLATLKGTVYDCELRPITNASSEIYIAAKPSNSALAIMKDVLLPEIFESVKERMSKGKPVAVKAEKAVENSEDIRSITPNMTVFLPAILQDIPTVPITA